MTRINWFRNLWFSCMVLLLTACNQVGTPTLPNEMLPQPVATLPNIDAQTELATVPPPQETEKDDTQMTQPAVPSGMEILIEKAKEDLAQRLSIAITLISLVEAKEMTWPDASLGCPQPGMKYKQIPYDGALIVLKAEGTMYEYHSGGSRGLFLCERTYKEPSPPPKIDIFNLTPSNPDTESKSDPPSPDNGIPPGEDQ